MAGLYASSMRGRHGVMTPWRPRATRGQRLEDADGLRETLIWGEKPGEALARGLARLAAAGDSAGSASDNAA